MGKTIYYQADELRNYGSPFGKTSWIPNWELIFREGYRFIVVDQIYDPFPNVDSHPDWVKVSKIYEAGDLIAYRLDYLNPPEKPLFMCGKSEDGVWKVMALGRS